MITTFYGAQSFGGDAAFVDRLVRALARRGHEIEVVHCSDAFEAVRGNDPLRPFEPPPGVVVHTLHSRLGILSPLWTHQTGRLGPKGPHVHRLLENGRFDVIHFHNVSLIGGPQLLAGNQGSHRTVRLMTAHEYWLVCPTHALFKLDRRPCERPTCFTCTLHSRRPPQLWRYTGLLRSALGSLDALICPSRFSVETHARLGVEAPLVHLPYFLPDDWAAAAGAAESSPPPPRPYLAAAGRFVKLKGFQNLIPLMADMPELDLRIAGVGPLEPELRRLSEGLPNVHFEGLLDAGRVAALFRGACAVVVPSLSWETFGYVVLEAFAAGVPAIVRRRGALPEIVEESGAGLVCESDAEFVEAARRLAADSHLRSELGQRGRRAVSDIWSEGVHVERYCSLIEQLARRRRGAVSSPSLDPDRAVLVDAAPAADQAARG